MNYVNTPARDKVQLLLGLILTLLVALLALSPLGGSFNTVTWTPKTVNDSGEFQLTRGWPNHMEITVDPTKLKDYQGSILNVGTWDLNFTSGYLILSSKGEVLDRTKIKKKANEYKYIFEAKSSTLKINHLKPINLGDSTRPIVTSLTIPQEAPLAITRVQMELRNSQYSNFPRMPLISIITLFFVTLGIRTRFVVRSPKQFLKEREFLRRRFWILLFALSTSSILIPAMPDDGWVLTRIGLFSQRGYLGNYFTNFDAPMPQGFIGEFVWSLGSQIGLSLIHYRLLISILLALAWMYIENSFLAKVWKSRKSDLWIPFSCFLLASTSFLITMRAEFWIFLLSIMSYSALAGSSVAKAKRSSFLLTFSLCVGIMMHQTGYVLLAPLFIFLFRNRFSKENTVHIFLGAYFGGLLAAFIGVIGMDLRTIFEGASDFKAGSGYQQNEIFRFHQFFSFTSSPRVFIYLLLFVFFLLSILFLSNRENPLSRVQENLVLASMLSPVFLFLTSSKWVWHLGAVTLPLVILGALVSKRILSRSNEWLYLSGLLITLSVIISYRYSNTWGVLDSGSRDWKFFSRVCISIIMSPVGFFICLLFFTALFFRRRLHSATLPLCFSALILLPTISNLVWMSLDLTDQMRNRGTSTQRWSPGYQNLETLLGRNHCGILDGIDSVRYFKPIPLEISKQGSSKYIESRSQIDAFNITQIRSLKYFSLDQGDEKQGSFKMGMLKEFGFWIFQSSKVQELVSITYLDANNKTVSQVSYNSREQGVLNWVVARPPTSTDSFRIQLTGLASGGSYVTLPGSYQRLDSKRDAEDLVGMISPYVQPYFPCIKPADPIQGFYHQAPLLIPGLFFYQEAELAQIGCLEPSRFCIYSRKNAQPNQLKSVLNRN